MKIFGIIPAYNEEKKIFQVVKKVLRYADEIIVIDDGSADKTGFLAQKAGARVYRHLLNRGLGAALATGKEIALKKGAEIIFTIDADGQHEAEDLPKLLAPVIKGEVEVAIGSRFLEQSNIPLHRRFYNWIANTVTWFFFGLKVSDSQSGLRCFNRAALQKIEIKGEKMEVSSEIIRELKLKKLSFKEVPIKAIYTPYSLSKGQNFLEGVKTLIRLILNKFLK